MATYYVDAVNGADANNGLGPDASAATNKPWKTIGKALGASGIASGDTVYLSPAGQFREAITVAMTSAVAETKIIGDPGNAQGFKTSGGVAVSAGPIIWSAYTTNDKTNPSASATLNLAGRDFLTFQYIQFVGGSNTTANIVDAVTTTISTNIKFTDCAFVAAVTSASIINYAGSSNTAATWTFDRCCFLCPGGSTNLFKIACPTFTGADYDIAFVVQNCLIFMGGGGSTNIFNATTSGALANKPGGIKLRNSTVIGGSTVISVSSNWSTSIPCVIANNFLWGTQTTLTAGSSGQISEDYNLMYGTTVRTNTATGTHSISGSAAYQYAPLIHFGQERIWGMLQRPFGEPMIGSPLLGFGNDGNQTAYDLRNKPRPAGGSSASPAAGAFERSNTFITDPSPIGGGGSPIKVTGPAYAEFYVPVPARAITISCSVQWDATYAGTKPQLQIDANTRIGVGAETKTAVGSSGAVETLTLSAFTPSKTGDLVTVRVISNDTNGAGVLQVDDFSVTG